MSELSVSVGLAREFRAQVRSTSRGTSGEAGSHRTEEMRESEAPAGQSWAKLSQGQYLKPKTKNSWSEKQKLPVRERQIGLGPF